MCFTDAARSDFHCLEARYLPRTVRYRQQKAAPVAPPACGSTAARCIAHVCHSSSFVAPTGLPSKRPFSQQWHRRGILLFALVTLPLILNFAHNLHQVTGALYPITADVVAVQGMQRVARRSAFSSSLIAQARGFQHLC
jgi:hypothetical protein